MFYTKKCSQSSCLLEPNHLTISKKMRFLTTGDRKKNKRCLNCAPVSSLGGSSVSQAVVGDSFVNEQIETFFWCATVFYLSVKDGVINLCLSFISYISTYLFIHLFICNLLLTAVPIISALLDQHLLFAGGNGLYVNVDCC